MDISNLTKMMGDPALKMEQLEVQEAVAIARLLRTGELHYTEVPSRMRVADRVKELHTLGHAVWGPPQWVGSSEHWVIWYFKKKA